MSATIGGSSGNSPGDSGSPAEQRPGKRRRWPEVSLATWGFGLNAAWEFAHSPLYADADRGAYYLAWTRLHCSFQDVLILLVSYWVVALVFRDRRWPRRGLPPAVLFVLSGLGYTIFSEWLNVSVRASWKYSHAMPVMLGIGLTPVLQWMVIPPLLVWLLRRRELHDATVSCPAPGEK